MLKKNKISNVDFCGALIVLAGLIMSVIIPTQPEIRAAGVQNHSAAVPERTEGLKQTDYGKMPLLFEKNKGQTDRKVKFVSRGSGYTLYLALNEAVFQLRTADDESPNELKDPKTKEIKKTRSDMLTMKFAGAHQNPTVEGEAEALTKTNYYIGQKRLENLPNYKRVNYKNLYEGIDAVFYGDQNNRLEYDFQIAPNADAAQIRLSFDGAENVSIDESGNLVIKTANTELVQQRPFAYQEIDGQKREVEVRYVITERSQIAFALGEYDRNRSLTIDPALNYLTYIGGTTFDLTNSVAVDSGGNAYIVGQTDSLNFPAPGNVPDRLAVYAAKISPDGSQFLYTTILDGENDELGFGIAIDAANNAYLTGTTQSDRFPVTDQAYQKRRSLCNFILTPSQCLTLNDEVFVTKLNSSGGLVYSTYLGGQRSDIGLSIAVDSAGKAYVAGSTSSSLTFPKKNEFQGTGFFGEGFDAFLTVFNASGSNITYSTGLGGNSFDQGSDIALDSANNAYITGFTNSAGTFPTKIAAQTSNGGGTDAFVAKFNPASSGDASLIYSTFLGGSGTDKGFGIAVSANGTASVTGLTGSLNFPLKNAFDSTNQINEAFVTQYGSTGAQLNSSFLGGADQEQGTDIAVGNGGTIYVTGLTLSNDFPMAVPFQATRKGLRDAFVAKIRFGVNNNPGVSSSSYLGGSGNDFGNGIAVQGNHIFVVGETDSTNLLTTGGVIKATSNASSTNPDGFVAKILDTHKDTIGTFDPINTLFNLKNALAGGAPDITVNRGVAGDIGVAGDFNGDGIDTVSTFNNGVWKITNFNVLVSGYGVGATTVNFGLPGDLPVVGDWDGDGIDTPGVFRPSTGQFFLTNSIVTNPSIDQTFQFGLNGDLPVAGDWDGDGIDTVGTFRPGGAQAQFFLTNSQQGTTIDITAFFGIAGDLPVAGDYDGNGLDTIGVWRPSSREFFLSNDNIAISNQFVFGQATDTPVIGDWDGKPNQ